jgi:glycosyltransferase involved in cell wall biosynthesis
MQAKDRFIWLAVGRLAPAKDYPNLLRAWAQIHEKHQAARLWIAGAGHFAEVITQNDLIGTAARHDSGVEWLGLRRDIADLLDAADGFVLSSAWEGMPLVIGEAMAMQKPLVATDVGGVRELVGDAGLLVPASDSQALAGAMLHIMTMNDQQRRSLGKQARERIELHFSMQTKADEWERLYHQLMAPEHK